MASQKLDRLQNNVYVLKHVLLDYGKQIALKDRKNKTSVVEIIYNSLLQMKDKSHRGADTQRLRQAFESLPLILHAQAFRSFITDFYISNHINGKIINSTQGTSDVVNELMDTANDFYEETGSVLSPFEVVFLTLKALLDSKNLSNPRYHKEAELFVGNIQAQKRILEDFLTQFDKQFNQIIKEEDVVNE
ncbi:hypothetical protein [Lactobacillus sp. ESL0230]|uniref:hypothetical protein n=1 Tax=Lactobacillus sp. ESL0230 TaxID=2069353 RepID=UPI000EFD9ACD|nr:hypothetical protein [Lactobacillus sp. ESL0230]RMC46713.1 hypothetical protein F5ESL0230_05535 [Lactobacillus sp. ESL0230]